MPREALFLRDGSTIAVIGAGPAGAFFADFALDMARQRGVRVEVIVFDAKDFLRTGPPGCNMCAGVISETLMEKLKGRGIVLPEGRVQRRIGGYYLQTKARGVLLTHPQRRKEIVTVYRGNGPRFSTWDGVISFDDFLLEHVQRAGAQVIRRPVREIVLPADPWEKVRLIYGGGGKDSELQADLAVGAFGLNTRMMEKVRALNFGYRPPRTLRSSQMELRLGAKFIREHLGDNIYLFSTGVDWLSFGSLIPKTEHVTVSVVGKRDLRMADLRAFLSLPEVRRWLPSGWRFPDEYCCCFPMIATTASRKPFTNRLVMIGDASFSRYYKNGIESAFLTAQLAAETAFARGVSAAAFKRGYWSRARRLIVQDNLYGRVLFKVNDLISRSELVVEAHLRTATAEWKVSRLLQDILWNMFTGNIPYRRIFWKCLNPRLQLKLLEATVAVIWERGMSRSSAR